MRGCLVVQSVAFTDEEFFEFCYKYAEANAGKLPSGRFIRSKEGLGGGDPARISRLRRDYEKMQAAAAKAEANRPEIPKSFSDFFDIAMGKVKSEVWAQASALYGEAEAILRREISDLNDRIQVQTAEFCERAVELEGFLDEVKAALEVEQQAKASVDAELAKERDQNVALKAQLDLLMQLAMKSHVQEEPKAIPEV